MSYNTINQYCIVFAGSGIGGMLRYLISYYGKLYPINNIPIPYWTLFVNIVASFIIGFNITNQNIQNLLFSGFCGGFSTFSSFSLETLNLFTDNNINIFWAFLNIFLNCLVSILFTFIGRLTVK